MLQMKENTFRYAFVFWSYPEHTFLQRVSFHRDHFNHSLVIFFQFSLSFFAYFHPVLHK